MVVTLLLPLPNSRQLLPQESRWFHQLILIPKAPKLMFPLNLY